MRSLSSLKCLPLKYALDMTVNMYTQREGWRESRGEEREHNKLDLVEMKNFKSLASEVRTFRSHLTSLPSTLLILNFELKMY